MNDLYGASIAQFKNALDEMKTIYDFDEDKTYFGTIKDARSQTFSCLEIMTRDEKTGINIWMNKHIANIQRVEG